MLFITW